MYGVQVPLPVPARQVPCSVVSGLLARAVRVEGVADPPGCPGAQHQRQQQRTLLIRGSLSTGRDQSPFRQPICESDRTVLTSADLYTQRRCLCCSGPPSRGRYPGSGAAAARLPSDERASGARGIAVVGAVLPTCAA